MSKSSSDPITRRLHRLAQAMGRRAHVRVAWTMQAPGQGLGKSQPPRPRIPTSRIDQAHAEKAMQSNMIFPDRLLETRTCQSTSGNLDADSPRRAREVWLEFLGNAVRTCAGLGRVWCT